MITFNLNISGFLDGFEAEYYRLIARVLNNGERRYIRGAYVYTLFGSMLEIDISSVGDKHFVFPMITSRKVTKKIIIEETLFFLRGEIDTTKLEKLGIHIWSGNTSQEFLKIRNLDNVKPGCLGPMYGYQLRHFNAPCDYYSEENMQKIKQEKLGFDQVTSLINKIKHNPFTRTLLMTTFNPGQVDNGCLYPCTGIVLQYIISNDGVMSSIMYQRSADLLIGVPHNIAAYALFTQIIATLCGYKAGKLTVMFGDYHVYEQHLETLNAFNERGIVIYNSPTISFPQINSLDDLNNISSDSFQIHNYTSGDVVKYIMHV